VNKYEAMIIFQEALKDTDCDEAVEAVRAEIEKLGGKMTSATRLGKREFAREMKKQQAGHYVLIAFQLDGAQVAPLHARLKLNPQVFRIQVVHAPAAAPAKEPADGVAE